jgi:hypothetical protein
MKKLAFYALIAAATLTTGCASILNESTQQVNVSSSNGKPFSGTVDGQPFQAPGVIALTRSKAGKLITAETAGCAKQTAAESSVDLKFFINVLIPFGVSGSTTDFATDKMWKYSDSVVVSCQ